MDDNNDRDSVHGNQDKYVDLDSNGNDANQPLNDDTEQPTGFLSESHDDLVKRASSGGAYTEAEARARSGNFIVPIGLPGSGKTTFLAAFFKYISEAMNLKTTLQINDKSGMPNYGGQAMVTEWERIWKRGRFLNPTAVGNDGIREVEYRIEPQIGEPTPINVHLLEISGEDLKQVVAEVDRNPRLPEPVFETFRNKKINVSLVFIVHPDTLENDELFESLITYLNRHMSDRLRTMSLLILVANPELALHRFQTRNSDMQVHEKLSGDLCKLYLREFAPRTLAIYNNWQKKKRSISPLYIGQVVRTKTEEGEMIDRIDRYNDTHMKGIFAWFYLQFTGRRIGDTFLQRFWKSLKN